MTVSPSLIPSFNLESATPDSQILNHFSLFLLRPLSGQARAWLDEHVQAGAMYFGNALAVEPRYLSDLLEGMFAAGLTPARAERRAR